MDWTALIDRAAEVVQAKLSTTPLVPIALDGFDAPTYLKLETVQPTGSFKVRGALAAVDVARAGGKRVVTASAGNHGLGLAYAATALGASATIVLPETASPAKIEALQRFAVDLRLVGKSYDEAEAAALELAGGTDTVFISAYTHPDVIAGQASIVREVSHQLADPFTIVVPVGGGGLASGTALAAPDRARVVGVESAASRAVSTAMQSGRIIDVTVDPTLADGLAGNIAPDALTPGILRERGATVTAVDETAIRAAMRLLALGYGVVAEGSGAVGLAAVAGGLVPADRPTVIVITGRNVAAGTLVDVLSERA